MDDQKTHERILISIALILCVGIVCYNFFFVSTLSPPTVVYVDKKSDSDIVYNEDEEDSDDVYQEDQFESDSHDSSLLNINVASVEELSNSLDGIGKVIAQRIVEYRENNGKFKSIEELMEIKGIGKKNFEKIKSSVCV